MKVTTASEMRDVDRRTIGLGIPGPILMENAGHRVTEFLQERFAPLSAHRIVILCGKGNNGGDGYVVARQLFTRFSPAALHVVAIGDDDDSEPRRMLTAAGCAVTNAITPEMRNATLVLDAVLGTGLAGPARGAALEAIHEVNTGFPLASVVAVDVPSGMHSDSGVSHGEIARADATITFTAPKLCHVLSPNCDRLGEFRATQIGSPSSLLDEVHISLSEAADFGQLLGPRRSDSNKGSYGHVLVVGGEPGKSGAPQMSGIAALRSGAGLVTVASSELRLNTLELMTASLPTTFDALVALAEKRNVVAIGPGLGTSEQAVTLVRDAVVGIQQSLVLDADALNALAGHDWRASAQHGVRVLTPHPGEMARLASKTVAEIQDNRLEYTRSFAESHNCVLVLKGHRTLIAMPDGEVFVNPTGSPSMATGGTGDVLTGMIAGLLAQTPEHPHAQPQLAVLAAVWLHGRCGELGAEILGEHSLIATDLLNFLPEAIRECQRASHVV
ncbi:MAG: NAD(P)H-hydrate dehydratase [Bryobacteraceae bacterium]|nr:NAD(P)H-hydrate dehydratase [Bryobacteraceae bacterium]